uniref:SFRICE_015728 n=1 Tax=Spodoptera frugiperda TaxID=7108 RepID=A0A2H1WWT8_SPOFR
MYDSWLCGGALVTTTQILTSAACIIELDNIYAIAGYRKYVSGMDLDKDNCTRIKKQKIVKIRVPREHLAHVHEYKNTTRWMSLDIGVATVEKPYNFADMSFRVYCSYVPAAIEINYNANVDSKIGTSVVALGWGRDRGSKTHDLVDRNSETLREVSTTIRDRQECIEQFKGNGLTETIEKYMICTNGKGMLDAEGYIIENTEEKAYNKCVNMRRQGQMADDLNFDEENDHGGPLITWVGTTELLVGIAVNSLYDADYNCIGPYLFISTAAAGEIIKCLLTDNKEGSTRKNCPADMLDGYEVLEHSVDSDPARRLRTLMEEPQTTETTPKNHPALRTNDADVNADDDFPDIEVVSI